MLFPSFGLAKTGQQDQSRGAESNLPGCGVVGLGCSPQKDRFSRGFDGFDYSGLCVLNERRGLVLARFIGSHPHPKSPSSEESRESVFCVPSAEEKRVRALRTVQNPPETPAGLSNPGLKTIEKQQN